MIQQMPTTANDPPKKAAMLAILSGIPSTKMAIAKAEIRPSNAATWALIWKKPRPPSSTSTGIADTSVDSSVLPSGS